MLDIDATDDRVHGRQEGRSHHGHYGHHCLLPLYILCRPHSMCAVLRPGDSDPAAGTVGQLDRIVRRLRREWPGVPVLVHADSAYAREEIMAWCEDNGVDYVVGVARNERLARKIAPELLAARVESRGRRRAVRVYEEFIHRTRNSWSRPRRVVAKAEHLPGKPNPRFLVTSPPDDISPRTVYERVHRPRGNAENAIKEQHSSACSPTETSASRLPANQLRLLFSAFASILMAALRRALPGTRLARATAGTLHLRLLRVGARVIVSARRVRIAMDSAHPSASDFARTHARLPGQTPRPPAGPLQPSPPPGGGRTGVPASSAGLRQRRRRPSAVTSPAPNPTMTATYSVPQWPNIGTAPSDCPAHRGV